MNHSEITIKNILADISTVVSIETEKMNKISNNIKNIEETLRKLNIRIQFSSLIKKSSEQSYYISWEPTVEGGKKFQLFLTTYEKDGKETFKKALIQTSFQIRKEFHDYLEFFLEEFLSHIEEINI